jgi:hypothetical protein
MNKVFSLLITFFSTFSAQFASANDGTEDYTFRPLSWYPLAELSASEIDALPEFCAGKYRPVAITPRSDKSILVEADESSASKNGDAIFKPAR